jgi:hypothetical protein
MRTANQKQSPITKAPKFIRDGGLILTVTDIDRKYRFGGWFKLLVEEIAIRYWPAIDNGLKITLIDAKEGMQETIKVLPELLGINNFGDAIDGKADVGRKARPFVLKYADMKVNDSRLGGVHIYYDGRQVKRVLRVNKVAVPQSLFAMVNLSPAWRLLLTPNKQDIMAEALDELGKAVYPMLKEMIDLLRSDQDDDIVADVDFIIRKMLGDAVVVDLTKPGKFKPGQLVPVGVGRGKGGGGGGGGKLPTKKPGAESGDEAESKTLPQTKLGISVRPDPTPNKFVAWRYEPTEEDGSPVFRVYVNRQDFPLIGSAYIEPYKLNVLVGMAASAFAEWAADVVRADPTGSQLAGMIDNLNKQGANIQTVLGEGESWTDFRSKIASVIVNSFELRQEEKRKLDEYGTEQAEAGDTAVA